MVVLGIGGIQGDAACAVLKDGKLVAAVEESKLTRRHVRGELPDNAIGVCLKLARLEPGDVESVALVRPLPAPGTRQHLHLREMFPASRVSVVEHHTAHAASAYYASPFGSATVLTLDREGDFRVGARWRGEGGQLTMEEELYLPDSLGNLYSRVTELLGYQAGGDEHKVQWLSTGGDDRYVAVFSDAMSMGEGAWPRVDRSYFDNARLGQGGFSGKFYERLGLKEAVAVPEGEKAAIAAGLQRAVEQAVIRMAGSGESLCLGGGVALNALLVASLERCGNWKQVFVQPVAGNAGTAIGAVYAVWHGGSREAARHPMDSLFLGPSYGAEETKQVLENCKLRFRYLLTDDEVIDTAVGELNDHKIVAWFQGGMEFGPRALGNRSLLASPQNPYSTENLNVFIKRREPFRKFAASVPAELASQYFEVGPNARYLATVGRVKAEHKGTFESAVLGADTVRVHTVEEKDNPLFWRLLHAAGKSTGLPVLYNTSFNLFGDPLVCNPRDAVRSFYSSGIDAMLVGHFLLQK